MKKVILNQEACIGCGACINVASENFTFNEDGKSELINDNYTEEANEASEICPVNAISIENDSENTEE